jgi:Flp pilus assembly protein TadG
MPVRSRRRRFGAEHGAAVVDFVLVSVLLVVLLFAVLQFAMFVYAHNIIGASAAAGARYAASEGVDDIAGGQRASELIRAGLPRSVAAAVPCSGAAGVDGRSRLAVATVRCRGRLPMLLLPFRIPVDVDVSAASVKEVPP